ncbi:MAG TPA: DUF4388 domain-containing protein [Polyangiaceae bacterium]|nr:DUF4388 domain-containing protein [Polyangiaceae bacterium]
MTSARGMTLVRALLDLQREKKWGTVDIEGGGTRTCIYLADGKPVSATEGTLSDTLGRLLMREGALTAAQYNSILARMVESLVRGRAMRFGEAAVSLGLLTSKQVQEALAAQVKQKVARCIALSHSTFTFTPSRDWANKVRRFPSTVEPLVLHAASSFDSERTGAILRPGAGTRARLLKKTGETAAAFALDPAEQRFLSMIDGRRTVRELLGESEVDASAILVALALSDHLSIVDASRPVAEQPEQSEPPPPRVSYAELIRERHHKLVSFTASKTPLGPSDSGARAPDVSGLEPKSPEQARLIADVVFTIGAGYLRSNSLARAAEELRRAAELVPDSREYTLFAKWAEFANEQSKLEAAEKGAALASLEVSAEAALEQVTDLGFAHYVLGQVYLNEGDEERALRSFKRGARLDPELIDADRHVRLLELRRRRSSSGEMAAATEKPLDPHDKPTVPAPSLPDIPTAPLPAAGAPPVFQVVASPPPPVVAAASPKPPVAAASPKPAAVAAPPPPHIPKPPPPRAAPMPAEPKVIIAPLTPPLPMMIAPPAPQPAPPVVVDIAPPAVASPPTEAPAPAPAEVSPVAPAFAPLPPFAAEVPAPLDTNEPIETGPLVPSLYSPVRARRRLAIAVASTAIAVIAAIGVAGLAMHHHRAKADGTKSPVVAIARAPETATVTATAVTAAAVRTDPTAARTAEVVAAPSSAPPPAPAASSHETAAAPAASSSDEYGMVQTARPTSSGHRITVDGHSIGDAPGPYRVRCGWHKVQVGSHGKPRRVEIACGGTTDLD